MSDNFSITINAENAHPGLGQAVIDRLRDFGTGAVRDSEDGKFDYEGFLSPPVLEAFAAYMHRHRQLPDGSLRGSDNWQNGIPLNVYMKSAWRHFIDVWTLHRGYAAIRPESGEFVDMEESLTGLLFNIMGYLHEYLGREGLVGDDS